MSMPSPTSADTSEAAADSLTVSVEEAGRLLGIGRSSAYSAVRRGEIPSIRVGHLYRVPRARLMALLGIEIAD